jgi:hypothetical protein
MDDPERQVERAEETMDDSIRRLEEHGEQLADDIDDARRGLDDMKHATGGDVAGDWADTDDAAGGEDPKGAHERE